MTDKTNLLPCTIPCPFCGEDDDLGCYPQKPFPEVICGNCGAHAPYDTWSTRDTTQFVDQACEAAYKASFKHGEITDNGVIIIPEERIIEAIEDKFK